MTTSQMAVQLGSPGRISRYMKMPLEGLGRSLRCTSRRAGVARASGMAEPSESAGTGM